jgi:hypothetical protein
MDNRFKLELEGMPDGEALEKERQAIQEALAAQGSRMARLHWALVRDTALSGLQKCLGEIDPIECIGKAWATAADIRKLAKETAANPGLEKELSLAGHSLSTELHPLVTIHCEPIELPTLRFTLKLDAAIECAVLIISAGKLVAVEAAKVRPSATLSFAERELKKLSVKPIDISRPYEFADGGLTI